MIVATLGISLSHSGRLRRKLLCPESSLASRLLRRDNKVSESKEHKRPKISVEHAHKYYGTPDDQVQALEDINIDVADGEFVCLVGPSGCGKSTLLWSISQLISLTQGHIKLDGEELQGPRDEIGLVFQDANLLPWRSLMENIYLPLEIKRLKVEAVRGAH